MPRSISSTWAKTSPGFVEFARLNLGSGSGSGPAGVVQVNYVVVRMACGRVAVGMAVGFGAFVALVVVPMVAVVDVLVRVLHGRMVVHDFAGLLARP